MKQTIILAASLGVAVLLHADPVVTVTSFAQNSNRTVTVDYTLANGPAIITFDVLTNGHSVGAANLRGAVGDVHRKVDGPSGTFTWRPDNWSALGGVPLGAITCAVKAWSPLNPPDWAVLNLHDGTIGYYESLDQLPIAFGANAYRRALMLMRRIPAANVRWRMGALKAENGDHYDNEHPLHYVTLTKDFYLAVYECTNYQYSWISTGSLDGGLTPACGSRWPSYDQLRGTTHRWPADLHQVASDSWFGKLRAKFGNAFAFDLPTEAQWEFAARGGLSGCPYDKSAISQYTKLSGTCSFVVGSYKPNNYGLYDMFGSVHECCLDFYGTFTDSEVVDPKGPTDTAITQVVYKGGGYWDDWYQMRAARRSSIERDGVNSSYHGFRVCLTLE